MDEKQYTISWNDGKGLRTLVVFASDPISKIADFLAKDVDRESDEPIFNGIEGASITPTEHMYE